MRCINNRKKMSTEAKTKLGLCVYCRQYLDTDLYI